MIGNQEEATLKVIVSSLVKKTTELEDRMDTVISFIQEFKESQSSKEILTVMKTDDVKHVIGDSLNTQLVNSTVKVDVKDPVASIDQNSKMIIDNLIVSNNNLIESNKSIKPRRPLLNVTVNGEKKFVWFGLGIASACLIVTVWALVWANIKVHSIEDQPYYWGNRAYQASLLSDDENPGKVYHMAVSHFEEQPERVKRFVDMLETKAAPYQEIKTYALSLISEKDSRDIRVLAWELDNDEYWILYRYFDEETERSIHRWPNGKVEETTDKIVKDLETSRKYSKRKIWKTIRDSSDE